MSSWREVLREALREAAKTPEERKREQEAKMDREMQTFYTLQVLPAFTELKEDLEQAGKVVEIRSNIPNASIVIRAPENLHFEEFSYRIMADKDGSVYAGFIYPEKHTSRFVDQHSKIKADASVNNVTKDEIGRDFVEQYTNMLRDLE